MEEGRSRKRDTNVARSSGEHQRNPSDQRYNERLSREQGMPLYPSAPIERTNHFTDSTSRPAARGQVHSSWPSIPELKRILGTYGFDY